MKKPKKGRKTPRKPSKSSKSRKKRGSSSRRLVLPSRSSAGLKNVTVVYGMNIDADHITRAAIEAYNKRRYTVHDVRLTEFIPDPKFRNLMVKVAVLDRIQEELVKLYPEANVIRPNTVTLMVR